MRCLLGALGALLVVSTASDGLPPAESPSSAPQQDPVDLPVILDSWYRVVQEDDHVGFFRERLERASARVSWRFDYRVELQSDINLPDPNDSEKKKLVTESKSMTARLDDTYSPTFLQMAQTMSDKDVEIDFNVTLKVSDEGGRTVVITLPNDQHRTVPISAEEDVYYSMPLMFISMRQNGLLSRPGLRQAKLFVPVPKGALVADVVFEVGEMVEREYLGKLQASVTPIRFEKGPPTVFSEMKLDRVYLDRYGRILERTTMGGIQYVISKGEEEAIGTGRLTRRGRRDPFRKDLPLRPEEVVTGTTGPVAKITKIDEVNTGNFKEKLKKAEKLLETLQAAVDRKQNKEKRETYDKILAYWEVLRNVAAAQWEEMIPRVDEMKRRADIISGIPKDLRNQAFALYERGIRAFADQKCKEMEDRLKDLREIQGKSELKSTEELEEVAKWMLDLDPKVDICKTRMELAQKVLRVSGTVIQMKNTPQSLEISLDVFGHGVGDRSKLRFVEATYIAIINGDEYMVGDTLKGEKIKVEKIGRQGVTVSLKSEQRQLPLSSR